MIDPDKFESKPTENDNNNNKVTLDKDTKSNKPKKGCCWNEYFKYNIFGLIFDIIKR